MRTARNREPDENRSAMRFVVQVVVLASPYKNSRFPDLGFPLRSLRETN